MGSGARQERGGERDCIETIHLMKKCFLSQNKNKMHQCISLCSNDSVTLTHSARVVQGPDELGESRILARGGDYITENGCA